MNALESKFYPEARAAIATAMQSSPEHAFKIEYLLNAPNCAELLRLFDSSQLMQKHNRDAVEEILFWRLVHIRADFWGEYKMKQVKFWAKEALQTWAWIAGGCSVLWVLLVWAVRWVGAGFRQDTK